MSEPLLRITPDSLTTPATPLRGTGRWITAQVASDRSRLDKGHINRLCLETWQHQGLARQAKLPSGQKGWEVDEAADSRFAAGKSPEQRAGEFDWNSLPESVRAPALLRLKTLKALNAELDAGFRATQMEKAEIIEQFIARNGLDVSVRTLQRWDERFRALGIPNGLLDNRLQKQDEQRVSDYKPFYDCLEDWYLRQGEPKMARCYQLARREAIRGDWPFPSLRTAQRHLENLGAARKIFARKGPKAFDDKCAAYCQRDFTKIRVIENGEPVIRPMESDDIWFADHHPCDVLVLAGVDGKGKPRYARPWLSAWQDARSRKIVGFRFLLTTPNSSTVLLALRDGIVNNGLRLPKFCYTDNGKDYDAWFWDGKSKRQRQQRVEHDPGDFKGIYDQLSIGHIHAKPYNAKAKPIERVFRTFEEGFNVFQPTYCGRNPQEKPEQLPDRLAAGKAPTFFDWMTEATAWIEDCYHNEGARGHGMDGRSPNEVHAANVGEVRPITLPALDCCLQLVNRPIKVGRNGITVQKRTYGKNDPALRALFGQEVIVRVDPADVRFATIWSTGGDRLCTLQENELAIFDTTDDATYRTALAEQTRHNKALKQVQKRGMRFVKSATEIMIQDSIATSRQRAEENPLPDPTPGSIRMIQTGLHTRSIDDLPALKQAAGAETTRRINSTLAAFAEDD